MEEKCLNTLIKNNFERYGFAYKIPDPQPNKFGQMTSIKRPFDIFACILGKNIYMENKMQNNGYKSFNYENKLEDHQKDALHKIKHDNHNNVCLVGLGVWERYKTFELLLFDYQLIDYLKSNLNKNSLLKKELIKLKQNEYAISITKKKFDVESIFSKIITIDIYKKLFMED